MFWGITVKDGLIGQEFARAPLPSDRDLKASDKTGQMYAGLPFLELNIDTVYTHLPSDLP